MPDPRPFHLILAAPPEAPGARALVHRAAAEAASGRGWRVLLTGQGLQWATRDGASAPLRSGGAEVVLCSKSAREQGIDPEVLPLWIRWSSLVSWLSATPATDELWTCLP